MKVCHFADSSGRTRWGLLGQDNTISDLSAAGINSLSELIESATPAERLAQLSDDTLPTRPLSDVRLLAPVDRQEIWAAGVTYLRSKAARMEESDFSATAYDRVYEADRPEIFFKSLGEKTVPTGESVGIRADGKWNVPEPELALVINSAGKIVGYTAGNDMSSRDIEGENLLYLPQAKVYKQSCSLGPAIVFGASEEEARQWSIGIKIIRAGETVFSGETSISQIKRSFTELAEYLCRSQDFPSGAVLLTGTGVVPPDEFTLAAGDRISINISGIGELTNDVIVV